MLVADPFPLARAATVAAAPRRPRQVLVAPPPGRVAGVVVPADDVITGELAAAGHIPADAGAAVATSVIRRRELRAVTRREDWLVWAPDARPVTGVADPTMPGSRTPAPGHVVPADPAPTDVATDGPAVDGPAADDTVGPGQDATAQDRHPPGSSFHRPSAWLAGARDGLSSPEVARTAVTRWLPQAGVVAVLAAAAVGNGMAGSFTPTQASDGIVVGDRGVLVTAAGLRSGGDATSALDDGSDVVAGADGLLRVRGADEASRSADRGPLPACDGVPPELPVTNGDVPDKFLCTLSDGSHKLRADAAVAFAQLDDAYAARFGTRMCVTSAYRTYAEQAVLRRQKGGMAAAAGTSEHGMGLAIDLCGGVENLDEHYWWLRDVAPQYGFDNPPWARKGGSLFEPWHWEYLAGKW